MLKIKSQCRSSVSFNDVQKLHSSRKTGADWISVEAVRWFEAYVQCQHEIKQALGVRAKCWSYNLEYVQQLSFICNRDSACPAPKRRNSHPAAPKPLRMPNENLFVQTNKLGKFANFRITLVLSTAPFQPASEMPAKLSLWHVPVALSLAGIVQGILHQHQELHPSKQGLPQMATSCTCTHTALVSCLGSDALHHCDLQHDEM